MHIDEPSGIKKDAIQSLCIGGFDGMHIAHQFLIKQCEGAGALLVIENGFANLTPNTAREKFTTLPIFYLKLSTIKHLSASEFIQQLLKQFPALCHIVVGYDFRFGKERRADAAQLKQMKHCDVTIVDEIKCNDVSVHAKTIRHLLQHEDIEQANTMLGRPYELCGEVIAGQGIGKRSLYATLNLETHDYLIPSHGVYSSKVQLENVWYESITFIGKRHSTDNRFSVEVHLLEPFKIQPKSVCVQLFHFIRKNITFDSLEELKQQISDDITTCKTLLVNV